MATIAPAAPPAPPRPKDSTGGGGDDILDRGFGGEGGGGFRYEPFPLSRYRTGMWVALAPIIMLFTALTSAYVVRQGLGDDWRPTALPRILWWNSLVLLASSVTMEMARRKAGGRRQETGGRRQVEGRRSQVESRGELFSGLRELRKWLLSTLLLGTAFLAGQIIAWRQLTERGIYLATNPSSSFFYVLTATHGVHLLGGIIGLSCVTAFVWKGLTPGGKTGVGVTAIYWHFMDGLWIYILLLLLLVP